MTRIAYCLSIPVAMNPSDAISNMKYGHNHNNGFQRVCGGNLMFYFWEHNFDSYYGNIIVN